MGRISQDLGLQIERAASVWRGDSAAVRHQSELAEGAGCDTLVKQRALVPTQTRNSCTGEIF